MEKIPVAILGATGAVGHNFVTLLQDHPWFEIVALAASEKSQGSRYGDLWKYSTALPQRIANMIVQPCIPNFPCEIVFSGLDSSIAGEIETQFAQAGYQVISNSRNHRMDPDVPLVVPEVNGEHLKLIEKQNYKGCIVTNPNCVVVGLVMALKPLLNFGIKTVSVTTMQAISGAGFNGVKDIEDNIIPYIGSEEEKVETEPLKILAPHRMIISAQCNRVPVSNGHTACVSVTFQKEPTREEILEAWRNFKGLNTPLAPEKPLIVIEEAPQPRKHLTGMSTTIGRLRQCPLGGWKFVVLCDNVIRGAAGCAILNAECMVHERRLLSTV